MIRVGLVGSGYWAEHTHAGMHTTPGPTTLVGMWARNADKAQSVAARLDVPAFGAFDELLSACDAVDFAIPPAAQVSLALRAAAVGKGLLLEKPIARDLGAARELRDEVARTGVATAVAMTRRYHHITRDFLDRVSELRERGPIHGAQATFLHGGALPGGFVNITGTWREDITGGLFDLGTHVIDLVIAALGPVAAAHCSSSGQYSTLELRHADGAQTQMAVSLHTGVSPSIHEVAVYGVGGTEQFSTAGMDHSECWVTLREEFARSVSSGENATVTVNDALETQLVLDACERSMESAQWQEIRRDRAA